LWKPVDRPKSVNLMWPPRSRRMLSGLISLEELEFRLATATKHIPVYETKLVDGLYRKRDLGHVETCNVFSEDFVLDQHCHQVTTWQELHKHVEESVVLEGRVQFNNPWTVGLGENITF